MKGAAGRLGDPKHHRQKRQYTQSATISVEIAIVSDQAAVEYYDRGGATSDTERIEMLAIKWAGVRIRKCLTW